MSYREAVELGEVTLTTCLIQIKDYVRAHEHDLTTTQAMILWRFTGDYPLTTVEVMSLGPGTNNQVAVRRLRETGYLNDCPDILMTDKRYHWLKISDKGIEFRNGLDRHLESLHG